LIEESRDIKNGTISKKKKKKKKTSKGYPLGPIFQRPLYFFLKSVDSILEA
jgi:hypothetical protein